MARSTDGRQQSSTARQAAHKSDTYRQGQTRQHRQAKSQPFDADDLCRRLYIVLAEQEAAKEKEKKRRERQEKRRSTQNNELDTSTGQSGTNKTGLAVPNPATTKPGPSETSFAARMARRKISAAELLKENTDPSREPKAGRFMSKSVREKLRRKSSRAEPTLTEKEDAINASSYHHVPQEAAAQFERTATGSGMRERNLEHSLSQSAVRFNTEGRRPSDQTEIDSSFTPAQQNHALERAYSHQEQLHERTQFRNPWAAADERISSEEGPRRHSIIGLAPVRSRRKSSFGNILEDEPLTIHPTATFELPAGEISSEETLAIDPATAHEHRVDWTQSDEIPEKPKTAAKIPLLRKADSLWTLKSKIGGLTKNGHGHHVRDEKMGAIREKQGQEYASSPSPPKFLRLGFLTKFKR
ncbi:hypothetical protein F5Y06DRAFT_283890 [Hypoxylon sp. FL0890]|nr:hypothetical protein F5Y06DRAFT_283890 [Hypoxylon sp. FL0890]